VAGVDAPSPSRSFSSSDSGRLEMVSSRLKASDPFRRLERYADAEVDEPLSDAEELVAVLRRMEAGAPLEDESEKVEEVVLPR
jgi:hypothetical protein